MNLNDIKKIYFIGIGGIGMSALARYFNGRGVEVHGYDRTQTPLTDELSAEGMTIHYEDDIKYIPENVDLVVYTPAVPSSHSELTFFRNNGYTVLKRAAVLGIISRGMKAIAVAGTHGKTTTTSITTHVLQTCGIDCTAFLGGIANNFSSNFVEGQSAWVVVEADEFDRSFLHLSPTLAVLTAMDADHLDIYGDVEVMHEGFNEFVNQTYEHGKVFIKKGLPLKPLTNGATLHTYGVNEGEFAATNIRVEGGYFVFDLKSPIENIDNLKFTLPGRHNVSNATAAIAIAQELGANAKDIRKSLLTFKGIKRRFEFIIREDDKVFIDDYAHHPEELRAAIGAAKELYPTKHLTGIFQPHLYTRTRDFVDGFAETLSMLDTVYLLDIYPAREEPITGVTSEIIFEKITTEDKVLLKKSELLDQLDLKNVEVLMTLGAGDIDRLVKPIGEKYLKYIVL